MKFWTIQTRNVLDTIQKKGLYQPDFSISRYLELNRELDELYAMILDSFNRINNTNLPGVVFAFSQRIDSTIYPIESIEEFKAFINDKKAALLSFWRHLDKENSVIMELDYENDFNPIYIDLNDFQFLMPPLMLLPPYTQDSVRRILRDLYLGQITPSELPSYVIQSHLPYIEKKNLVNTYPVFDLDFE